MQVQTNGQMTASLALGDHPPIQKLHVHVSENGSGDKRINPIAAVKRDWMEELGVHLSQAPRESGEDDEDGLLRQTQELDSFLADLLSTISSLKHEYVQMRSAHFPYDPVKLRSSDKAVVSELKKLTNLSRNFQEKLGTVCSRARPSISSQRSSEDIMSRSLGLENRDPDVCFDPNLVKNYEAYLQKFREEIRRKDAKIKEKDMEIEEKNDLIKDLKQSLLKATGEAKELGRASRKHERRTSNPSASEESFPESALVPQLFEMAVEEAKHAASSFNNILLKCMKEAKWDIDAAANSIERGIHYLEQSHKRFAFESYVCHRMFDGFETENFSINTSFSSILSAKEYKHDSLLQFQEMRFVDPSELVTTTPDSLFAKFCHRKYLQTVHQTMEEAFFGHLQQRSCIINGGHPTTIFYKSFLRLSKSVWLLHLLSFAFTPTISIFHVKRKSKFHPLYMENLIQPIDFERFHREVGLTVFPGFFLEKQILRCQVYLEGIYPGN